MMKSLQYNSEQTITFDSRIIYITNSKLCWLSSKTLKASGNENILRTYNIITSVKALSWFHKILDVGINLQILKGLVLIFELKICYME